MDEQTDTKNQAAQTQACVRKHYISPVIVVLNYPIEAGVGLGSDGGGGGGGFSGS